MRNIVKLLLIALLVSLPLAADNQAPMALPAGDLHLPSIIADRYVPGTIIVKLKSGSSLNSSAAQDLWDELGVASSRELFPGAQPDEFSNIFVLTLQNPYADINELSRYLKKSSLVEYAQPDYLSELGYAPIDPYYYTFNSWRNETYRDMWALRMVNPDKAWDLSAGDSTIIAIIDTGMDFNHPDLQGQTWINMVEWAGYGGTDDDGNGFKDDIYGWDFAGSSVKGFDPDNDPTDYWGHGTLLAGIASALTDNYGILGLAHNSKIMAVKAFYDCQSCIPDNPPYCVLCPNQCIGDPDPNCGKCKGALTSDGTGAIRYAADNGADVINMSYGSWLNPINKNQLDAIKYAYSKGAVLVTISHNQGWKIENNNNLPARYPWVITVGGVARQDSRWVNSNFGTSLDVVAPAGGNTLSGDTVNIVLSCAATEGRAQPDRCNNPMLVGLDNKHIRQSGTSLAAPFVSALAAMIKSRHPEFTNEQIRQVIRVSADDITWDPLGGDTVYTGFDIYTGYGRINSFKALCGDSLNPLCDTNPVRDMVAHPQEALIISPWDGDIVGNTTDPLVAIYGIAKGPEFTEYILEYGAGVYPGTTAWIEIARSTTPTPGNTATSFSVDGSLLGTLDTRTLSTGEYTLLLTVHSSRGHSFSDRVTFQVARPIHGFPTLDLNDGKFVVVTGADLGTVPVPSMTFFIGVSGEQDSFTVQVYDGDMADNFGDYVFNPGNTKVWYTLFADPYKNGQGTTIIAGSSSDDMPDQGLFTIYSDLNRSEALAGGNYFYRLEVVMGPNATTPDYFVKAQNSFKVLTTGQIGITYTDVQFMGLDAVGDYRAGSTAEPAKKPLWLKDCPNAPRSGRTSYLSHGVDTNYDGQFSFYFYVTAPDDGFSLVDSDADSLLDGCKDADSTNLSLPGRALGENYSISYLVTDPKGGFLKIRKVINGQPVDMDYNYNWDVSGNYDPFCEMDSESARAVCGTCREGYHKWLWFNVMAENNVNIEPPGSSTYELMSEPYPFLPVSSAQPPAYYLEQPQGYLEALLPVVLGRLDANGVPINASILVEREVRARQILKNIGPDLLIYPPELRDMISQLLAVKFNLQEAEFINEPLYRAKILGSDWTVIEIVNQADNLIASIQPSKIPGQSHVKFIRLSEAEKSEVRRITLYLDLVNRARVVYYER